jgi:hypothetical protein
MIENADTLYIYIHSQNSEAAEFFSISKNSEGYYPPLSLDNLIEQVKRNKKYGKKLIGIY